MIQRLFFRNVVAPLPPAEDPNSFGNIAVEKGYISREVLTKVLTMQEAQLSEMLVRENILTSEQRDEIVLEQKIRKGEKVSTDVIRASERKRMHRHLRAVMDCFKEAGEEAKETASVVMARAKVFDV